VYPPLTKTITKNLIWIISSVIFRENHPIANAITIKMMKLIAISQLSIKLATLGEIIKLLVKHKALNMNMNPKIQLEKKILFITRVI